MLHTDVTARIECQFNALRAEFPEVFLKINDLHKG